MTPADIGWMIGRFYTLLYVETPDAYKALFDNTGVELVVAKCVRGWYGYPEAERNIAVAACLDACDYYSALSGEIRL